MDKYSDSRRGKHGFQGLFDFTGLFPSCTQFHWILGLLHQSLGRGCWKVRGIEGHVGNPLAHETYRCTVLGKVAREQHWLQCGTVKPNCLISLRED